MGPVERQAAAAVGRLVWPLNPVSRRVARAVVVAARVLDRDPRACYLCAGRAREVFDQLTELLGELRPSPNLIHELRAERLCRAVERGNPITDAEMQSRMSAV